MTVNVIKVFDAFVEDVLTWYIRRSRRRFWQEDDVAFRTSGGGRTGDRPRSSRSSPRTFGRTRRPGVSRRARLRVPGRVAGARRPGRHIALRPPTLPRTIERIVAIEGVMAGQVFKGRRTSLRAGSNRPHKSLHVLGRRPKTKKLVTALKAARASDMPSKPVWGRELPGGFDSRPPPLQKVVSDQPLWE
jgi:hypothetical protein